MNEDKAAVALRLIIRAVIGANAGDPQSLRNVNTSIFPDGAECFVTENRARYQLSKQSVAVADNVTIVAPIAGPGRWIILIPGTSAAPLVEVVGTNENNVPSSGTVDLTALNSSLFAFEPVGVPGGFTLTALGAILTYQGSASVRCVARLDSSVSLATGGGGGGLAPGAVDLRTAGNFTILAKSGISNVPTSVITGDMGVSPIAHTAITGFALVLDGGGQFSTSAQVTGKIYAADYAAPTPATMTQAVTDMQAAYVDASTRVANFTNEFAGNLGGQTLTAGVHHWTTGVTIPTSVTLSGSVTDVFILQVTGTLTMTAAQSVILTGGVLAKNVFWQVTGAVSIGATATFNGIILAFTNIAMVTGSTINGRLLAQTAVALDNNTVSAPTGATSGLVWAAIAQNADVIGVDPTVSFLPGTQVTEATTEPSFLSTERTILLAPGDTIQPAFATATGSDINASRVTLTLTLG